MPRVYEVARELGISSREVMERLDRMGTPVTSHASSIDEATSDKLRTEPAVGLPEPAGNGVVPAAALAPVEADTAPAEPPGGAGSAGAGSGTAARAAAAVGASTPAPSKRRSALRHLAELPMLVAFAFVIAIIIKTFLVQAFFIPSRSMNPTLKVGDRVLVEKISYLLHGARRGDVVVFARDVFGDPPDVPWTEDARNFFRDLLGLPTGNEEDYIKRVVAVGGDTIRYAGEPRVLEVNGKREPEPYVKGGKDRSSPSLTAKDCARLDMERAGDACRVPAGRVFVMGDNRGNSEDSRILGPVDEDKIVGRAFVILWPPGDFGTL